MLFFMMNPVKIFYYGVVGLLDENPTEFFRLWFYNDCITNSFDKNIVWFIDFDSPCGLNDSSYLLYSTHAILLIIAGVVLLIAMVGAISLTLQKNCPESLYKQLEVNKKMQYLQ